MRLFFAIELPPHVKHALGALRLPEAHQYRWVDPDLLHVTLAFLGQQPDERLETLEHLGRAAASQSQAGVLRVGQRGSFGPRREPRVLWIGLEGDLADLIALQTRLATTLRRAGITIEDRPFAPLVTLARRRDGARAAGPPAWPPTPPAAVEPFRMDHLTLVESRLSPRGPTYIPRLEFPIGRGV